MTPTDGQDVAGAAEGGDAADVVEITPEVIEETEIERLSRELRESQARLRTVSAAYKNLQDDMKSYQARVARQQELKLEVHKGETVARLFTPLEDLQRTIDGLKKAGGDAAILSGLEMVHREFMGGFNKLGLEEVPGQGAWFDPTVHEAMSVIPVPTPEMGDRVLEVFTRGYKVGARLIRPARVIVGRAPDPPAPAPAAEAGEGEE